MRQVLKDENYWSEEGSPEKIEPAGHRGQREAKCVRTYEGDQFSSLQTVFFIQSLQIL